MSSVLNLGLISSRKIGLVRQTQTAECGLACLAMVARYHGLASDLRTLRRMAGIGARGMTLRTLIRAAEALGLACRAVKVELVELRSLALPAILHWDMNHFVVLEAVRRGKAQIHDPNGSSRWMKIAEVSDHFTGVALELEPTISFVRPQKAPQLRLRELWTKVTGLKRAIGQALVLSLVLQAYVLASPYYLQLVLDSAIPALDISLLQTLAVGFGIFVAINAVAQLIRNFVLLSAGTSFSQGLSSNVCRKLFRLPIEWFERRQTGDVLSRFQSIVPIRLLVTDDVAAILIDGMLLIATIAMMLFYSVTLTVISLSGVATYILLRLAFFGAQRSAQEATLIADGKEQTTLIESLHGIRTLRLANRESLRHALWLSRLTESLNATIRMRRYTYWLAASQTAVLGLESIISIWVAAGFVMAGGFSVGMLFAFAAYKAYFLQTATSLVDRIMMLRMVGVHLERLADIALAEDDHSVRTPESFDAVAFSGKVELRNVSYRYSKDDPLVLDNINLLVAPGECLAVTGPSGEGKSTLVRILLGLTEPTSGTVLIDGVPLSQFGYQAYYRQIAGILQDDTLFGGSIADNICMFDDVPDWERMIDAANAAAIAADIEAMPMKYHTLVGDMGNSLSGGQRQRLLVARSLYQQPRLLVMDEATSHLDVERERKVGEAISRLKVTRVIVAHRQETINMADRVIVVEKGRISN